MTKLKQALIGTAAATAMAVSATPAMADDYNDRHYKKDKIGAGEVIAGAVILGGLAAILSSGKKDRHYDRNYHRGNRGYGYNDGYGHNYKPRRGNGRRAVKRCIRNIENRGYYGRTDVTQIRDVERTRYGWKVKGRLVVKNGYRHHRGNYNYDGYKRYKSNYGYRGNDRGRFTCYIERGRVVDVRYRGLGNYR